MDRSADHSIVVRELLRACCRRGIPPVPPPATRRALDLAGDDDANNDSLIDQIESDPRLRFGLVAGANLPMFCGSRPIKSVRQGVYELGRRRIVSLLWLVALSDFLRYWTKPADPDRNRLWRHSLLTGVLAQQLMHVAGFDGLGDALTVGLAHDIGHLLPAWDLPRLGIAGYEDFRHEDASHEENGRFDEQEALSTPSELDHCRLGASLLAFWGAPAELVSCADHHHDPEASTISHRPLVVAVRLADLMAKHLVHDCPIQALRFDAMPGWQQLAIIEPWRQVVDLHHLVLERLPDSLVTAEHLARVLGG